MRKIYTVLFTLFLFCNFSNVQAQVPNCTTNITPVNNATNLDPYPSIALTWNAVAGATSYDVYVSPKIPPKQMAANVSTTSYNVPNLFYNTVYYWYVVPRNASGAAIGCSSSNVTKFTTMATPPPPANDDCDDAPFISTTPVTGMTVGATQSQPASFCSDYTGNADDDVWFQFTAPSNSVVTFTMTGNGNFDGVFEAFSGTCGALTSLTCSDTSQLGGREQLTLNTTTGTNYKFRVYGFYGTLSSRGNFTISSSHSTLPINLISFKGEKGENSNILKWSTASEQNNAGYEILYSADGSNFEKLSFVNSKAANGYSSSQLDYQFSDAKNFNSNAYYRLKQIDKDGRSSLSNIVFLKGKNARMSLSNIYPNPVHNSINLTLDVPATDNVNIEIRDIAGKVVFRQAATVVEGANKLPLNVSSLPGGSYFIKAISKAGEQTAVSKLVKQ